jgi:hypothetical protein
VKSVEFCRAEQKDEARTVSRKTVAAWQIRWPTKLRNKAKFVSVSKSVDLA